MLEFIFRKISNQFLSESSLELSFPENAVASYDLFLAGTADNPFVLFTTHTLMKHSLFFTTNQLLQRSGKRIMSWLPEAWLTWIRPHVKTRLPWQVDAMSSSAWIWEHTPYMGYMQLHQYRLRAGNHKRLSSLSEKIQEMLSNHFIFWLGEEYQFLQPANLKGNVWPVKCSEEKLAENI